MHFPSHCHLLNWKMPASSLKWCLESAVVMLVGILHKAVIHIYYIKAKGGRKIHKITLVVGIFPRSNYLCAFWVVIMGQTKVWPIQQTFIECMKCARHYFRALATAKMNHPWSLSPRHPGLHVWQWSGLHPREPPFKNFWFCWEGFLVCVLTM